MSIFTFNGVSGASSEPLIVNSIPKLAVDPVNTYGSTGVSSASIPDSTGGYQTALSLTGKFAVCYLAFESVSNGATVNVRLTVDGTQVMDYATTQSLTLGTVAVIGGQRVGSALVQPNMGITFMCETSLLLEVQSTDAAISLSYIARPIL